MAGSTQSPAMLVAVGANYRSRLVGLCDLQIRLQRGRQGEDPDGSLMRPFIFGKHNMWEHR